VSSSPAQIDRGESDRLGSTDPALLLTLADPATYGGAPVVVHETHASWVFVAGERAYKIKKPVALGFLDYSTLERRRSACAEEVRVNQDLAPGIYLGVRAIVRTKAGFAFAPNDHAPEAVEYAVEMRSFDEADTLAGLIASQALTPEHLKAVAGRVAAFHRLAPTVAGGDAGEVLGVWQRNLLDLRQASQALEEFPVHLAGRFAEMFVRLHEAEIERRRAAGLVRDVHGDLRCEHVLLTPDVRVVDRIEFDASLRHTDIACDLAFLTMDLEAHDQRWAAETVACAYRDTGMDAGSDALLSFYCAHRALIRATVDLVGASEHDGERRAALLTKARSKLALAERLCWRARAPLAIVVCGPAGSGKSTLAAELSKRSGFAVLSSDAIRKSEAGLHATDRAAPEHYSHGVTHHTYELLASQAHELISHGSGVIVDATCRSRVERSTLLGRLARTGAPRLVVRCEVPLEVALARAARREHDPARVSDAGPQIVAEQYHSFQQLEELAPEGVLGLDTRRPLRTQVVEVTSVIDRLLMTRAGATATDW
jgi:aminoglycoside phosphotransferase family enzyme/predicted kinase